MKDSNQIQATQRSRGNDGFSVIETMIAAILLLIVFFMMAQAYTRGRVLLDHEEDRRRATTVLQARLDGIRRDFTYDNLNSLAGSDTTYVVDDLAYTVSHQVLVGSPEVHTTTLTLTVTWNAVVDGTNVPRSHTCLTILSRGLPWSV